MELEVGMYVRTNLFGILKLTKITKDDFNCIWYWAKVKGLDGKLYDHMLTKEQIVKSSYNIIDLIEVGDYVNKYKVDVIQKIGDIKNLILSDGQEIYNADIKSVLTKEQYEANVYGIGSDE